MTEFSIQPLIRSPVADAALERLLRETYVSAGYTDADRAATLFSADAVHARGSTRAAYDGDGTLVGTGTLVIGGTPASRLATGSEAELHLLAVAANARGRGVGEAIVNVLLQDAKQAGAATVWLWTQPAMLAAQRLYLRLGFHREPVHDFRLGDRTFLVFARACTS